MPSSNSANYVALISAGVGVISAFVSFFSYRLSKKEGTVNRYNSIIEKCRSNLDESYLSTSEFINKFSEQDESIDKKISREQIMYLLELLRKEFPTDKINTELNNTYDNLLVLISDITYENNEGKIFRDLAKIKSHISTLKESLTLIK